MTAAPARLLELDAELAEQVPEEDRAQAIRALRVPVLRFRRGPLHLVEEELPEATWALVVLSGTVLDESRLADRELAELVLPGEVLLPWAPSPAGLASERSLHALGDVQLAVLDRQFLRACAAWPQLMVTISRRLNDQEHRVATRGLICQLPRVDQRVLGVLWHLAERIGRVSPDGVIVPLDTTHAELGRLIGAQRPTVSLAVKQLAADGRLQRRSEGGWLLAGEPFDAASS
ncbi:MAG TPA: Crp/Fnr family transcriptional regulator, partial [Solirubrobacteraceae bacterium]|nr:Crp/Fnr family transcriptional regulator [Solirubrobacteraceae bacterium]